MRHPFGGLLPGVPEDPGACDRRSLLHAMLAGTLAGTASGNWAFAQPASGKETSRPASGPGHRLYVVVPKDLRRFGSKRRHELGVWGPYFVLQEPQKPPQAGFLAWLTEEQAKKLSGQDSVAQVVPLERKLVPGPGPRPQGATQLLVELAPNSFYRKAAGYYQSTDDVIKTWRKQLARWVNVGLEMEPLTGRDGFVVVRLPVGQGLEEALQAIKSHPQVARVRWYQPQPTTLALGEEGGPRPTTARGREEGGVTTLALGEEGGPPPTTRRAGEEGDRPPLTPLNGEAGGPTTKALREEGGVTTFALGEEGNRPRPRR